MDNMVNGIKVNDKPKIKKVISVEYKYTFQVNNESIKTAPIMNATLRHLYITEHHESVFPSPISCPSIDFASSFVICILPWFTYQKLPTLP